jgi:hypothetical protein
MKTKEINEVSIDLDKITLRFGEMEPVVIPRNAIRTRLRLIDWIYRLTGWPGMNVRRLRTFIEAIYQHHGWPLPAWRTTSSWFRAPRLETKRKRQWQPLQLPNERQDESLP